MIARRWSAGLGLLVLLVAAGCGGGSSASSSPGSTAASIPAAPAAPPPAPAPTGSSTVTPTGSPGQLYVSVGDSYAAGYQPTAPDVGHTTTNGFAYQVVDAAKAKGYDLRLTNFGCGGATTTSVLSDPGCKPEGLGPGAASYNPQTQVAAAEAFLQQHRGKVALVTVSIGGNDVTACGKAQDPVSCVSGAVASIKKNLGTLVTRLRAAAGPQTRIVGITYPDVILGDFLSSDPKKRATAGLSVVAFRSLINPALKAGYESVGGSFVDVTAATGAYGPLTAKTVLPGYGSIPTPVAKVCQLTYYCQFTDIHPRTEGYTIISDLVVGTLPRR